MIELETPLQQQPAPSPRIDEVHAEGNLSQLRGDPAPGGLRRHPRQRPAPCAARLPRGRGRHQHPDRRRLPRVQHDRERQGGRHPDRAERQEASASLVRTPPADAQARQAGRRPGDRRRHRRVGRRGDRQPRPRPAHARLRLGVDRDGPHHRDRHGLSAGRAHRGDADRRRPGRRASSRRCGA